MGHLSQGSPSHHSPPVLAAQPSCGVVHGQLHPPTRLHVLTKEKKKASPAWLVFWTRPQEVPEDGCVLCLCEMQLGLAGTGCSGPTVSARRAWETGKPQAEEKDAEYLRSVHALGYKVPCPTEQQVHIFLSSYRSFCYGFT